VSVSKMWWLIGKQISDRPLDILPHRRMDRAFRQKHNLLLQATSASGNSEDAEIVVEFGQKPCYEGGRDALLLATTNDDAPRGCSVAIEDETKKHAMRSLAVNPVVMT
jgi:hypothetical protein